MPTHITCTYQADPGKASLSFSVHPHPYFMTFRPLEITDIEEEVLLVFETSPAWRSLVETGSILVERVTFEEEGVLINEQISDPPPEEPDVVEDEPSIGPVTDVVEEEPVTDEPEDPDADTIKFFNEATSEELELLENVGSVTAARIAGSKPYTSLAAVKEASELSETRWAEAIASMESL